MSDFYPSHLKIKDMQSPMEILKTAKKEWEDNSDGRLTLILQEALSSNDHHMIIVDVRDIASKKSITIFSVVHRPNMTYPATLQPENLELPNFLKKTYAVQSGHSSMVKIAAEILQEKEINNKWVSNSASEFRIKLSKIFCLDSTEVLVMNLVSQSKIKNSYIFTYKYGIEDLNVEDILIEINERRAFDENCRRGEIEQNNDYITIKIHCDSENADLAKAQVIDFMHDTINDSLPIERLLSDNDYYEIKNKTARSHEEELMSTLEIAALTGKRHSNILRDTEKMLTDLQIDVLEFQTIYKDNYSRDQKCYKLNKELSLTLVSGYNVQMRHAIVKRWCELDEDLAAY